MEDKQEYRLLTCACGQKMKVRADAKASAYKCPKCGEKIAVEDPSALPAHDPQQKTSRDKIGQMLIDANLITADQLADALATQKTSGGKTFEILIRKQYLTKEALHKFLSQQPGVATIELSRFQIDRNLTALVPREIALNSLVLPIDKLSKLLTVAMACPLDIETISGLEKATGLKVKALLCRLDDIHAAVQKYYPLDQPPQSVEDFRLLPKRKLLTPQDVERKIASFDLLPIRKETAERLAAMEANSNGLAQYIKVTLEDPCLAANIIATANTRLFESAGEVSTPAAATILLGADAVSKLARNTAVQTEIIFPWLQLRAIERARIARLLAERNGDMGPNLAAAAALLYELGRYAITKLNPETYQPFKEFNDEAVRFAESKKFPLSHTKVASILAAHWHYPRALAEIFEEGRAESTSPLQALVSVSQAVVEHQLTNPSAPLKLNPDHLAAIRLTEGQVFETINQQSPAIS